MIKNYLTLGFRNLFKHKFYSFINVAGLSIGIAVSMLILFYVYDELSYDRYHTDADRMYHVYMRAKLQGKEDAGSSTNAPLASAAVDEIPEVESAVRITTRWNEVIRYEDNIFTEERLLLADSNFFDFFTFELLEGNPNDILNEPNQLILTETSAKKFFDYEVGEGESPIGKMMLVGSDKRNCSIVGIVEDPPKNSTIQFNSIQSMQSWDWSKGTQWTSNSLMTYLKLNEFADPEAVQEKLKAMTDKYIGPEIQMYLGMSLEQWRETGDDYGYFIQPFTDIYLKSQTEENSGRIAYIYLLSIIAFFIIAIACINFMNLSTARSTGRAKEVGIRKTVGAERGRLISQFMTESILISSIATVLAVIILYISLPYFNLISGKEIPISFLFSPASIGAILLIMLVVGLLAGSYPAFYLTNFKPTEVLKGTLRAGTGSRLIRSILVIFQFTISVGLIVSTIIIYKQLQLLQNKNLGFHKENLFVIQNANNLGTGKQAFKETLLSFNDVNSASISNLVPPWIGSNSVYFPNGKQDEGILHYTVYADPDFQKTLGFTMYSGRFLSKDFPSDSHAVVINKAAIDALGWENHENNWLSVPREEGKLMRFDVIGVMDDFNYASLHNEIEPMAIFLTTPDTYAGLLSVRLNPGDVKEQVKEIEKSWKKFAPGEPFDYNFMDESYDNLFRAEQRLGKIFLLFTSLAIFIACLGLFGLVTFIAEKRSKEIGIRKALGASVRGIVLLLSNEFTKLVFISILIAVPGVILLMNWWLENFAYRTKIDFWSFLLGGVAALLISLFTISYQSIKAAIANPTKALRYE
jgi:putative ABC transport system permease protein